MGQAQINVRTRACSRTSIARTKQAALTHNVRGKELIEWSQPIRHDFLLLRAHIVTFFRLAFHDKGWQNDTKAAFFVITETQFAIQSQVT